MKLCIILLMAIAVVAAVPATVSAAATLAPRPVVEAGVTQDPTDEDIAVRPVSGGVEVAVSSPQAVEVTVWDITGQAVARIIAIGAAITRIDLPRGCYIVRAGTVTRRIAVG